MNMMFLRSIEETRKTIDKNGLNIHNYSEYEKGVLMTCVNVAKAVSDIVNIPVVDANGKISRQAIQMIETGENYLKEINEVLSS